MISKRSILFLLLLFFSTPSRALLQMDCRLLLKACLRGEMRDYRIELEGVLSGTELRRQTDKIVASYLSRAALSGKTLEDTQEKVAGVLNKVLRQKVEKILAETQKIESGRGNILALIGAHEVLNDLEGFLRVVIFDQSIVFPEGLSARWFEQDVETLEIAFKQAYWLILREKMFPPKT